METNNIKMVLFLILLEVYFENRFHYINLFLS